LKLFVYAPHVYFNGFHQGFAIHCVAVSIERKKGTFSQKKTEKRKLIQQGRPEGLSRLTAKKFLP